MKLNTQNQKKTENRIIFLFGPTAVGKTDLLCSLFSRSCEVVNADSVQVYRHLNIGSAKADAEVLSKIPHHLIDIRDPWDNWNVNDFVSNADKVCKDVQLRGKIPVISGGTAFYFKTFLYGLSEAPPVDPAIRQEVSQWFETVGKDAAHTYLASIDPVSAARINVNDTYRITRAVEVFKTSGKPLSSFALPTTVRNNMDVVIIGLTWDKEVLASRIRKRVKIMFDMGLVNEIKGLVAMGAKPEWQSMQGIGYKEFMNHVHDGKLADNLDVQSIAEEIAMNSIHYAKRQMTFFKSFENVNWFSPEDKAGITALLKDRFPDLPEEAWPSADLS